MTAFVGLDLAWTPHHPSGVCVLVGSAECVRLESLNSEIRTPGEFAAMCHRLGKDVVVAVDAPLVVEPERRAEALLAKNYAAKHAGAYSANMKFLENMNGMAGPTLARCLAALEFELDPARLSSQVAGRFALEVFPHPAHIELFQLPMALKYKKGLVAAKKVALGEYQIHLAGLLARELPQVLAANAVREVIGHDALAAKGKALKSLEDRLDALTCACVAYHCWKHGHPGMEVFGCADHGCIVVPTLLP